MPQVEIRQLEYFVAAADLESYSAAANRLFVSPQAISRSIQILERQLGVILFTRKRSGIAITEFGKLFYDQAQIVLKEASNLEALAAAYKEGSLKSITVGIHSLCFKDQGGSLDWNDLLLIHDTYRDADISFVEMGGNSINRAVLEGRIDFGIGVVEKGYPEGIDGILLKQFPLAAIVAAGPFLENENQVTLEQLKTGKLMLFAEEDCLNEDFIHQAEEEGIRYETSPLRIRAYTDISSLLDPKHFIVRSLQHALRMRKSDSTRVLPILNKKGEPTVSGLYLIWKEGRRITDVEQSFIDEIISVYSS